MAAELVKRTIGGHEYEFEQFGAKQSLRVLVKLSKLLAKPLALSIGAFKKGEDGKKFDETILAEAAKALFDGMDENATLELIELLTSEKVICDGKKIKFDSHYENNLTHLFEVLTTALDVQYGNFIEGLLESIGSQSAAVSTPVPQT